MEPGLLLHTLRSPSGVDMYPPVIQVLLVLTWAVHMFFIQLTLGALGTTIIAFLKRRRPAYEALSTSSIKIAIISLSLGVVFGVAPLLFTQVIYDAGWYVGNNLSAWWVILFVPIVIVAYYTAYASYFYIRRRFQSAFQTSPKTTFTPYEFSTSTINTDLEPSNPMLSKASSNHSYSHKYDPDQLSPGMLAELAEKGSSLAFDEIAVADRRPQDASVSIPSQIVSHKTLSTSGLFVIVPLISFVFLLTAAAIMHTFSYQALFPERWIDWYTASGTTMNTDGWHIYAFSYSRYAFFIALAFFVYGLFMRAYAWYFSPRKDVNRNILQSFSRYGIILARISGPIAFVLAILTNLTQGSLTSLIVVLSLVLLGGAIISVYIPANHKLLVVGPWILSLAAIADLATSLMREGIRLYTYGLYQHTPHDYPLHLSFWGISFFLGTFVVGVAFFNFLLRLLYQSGRVDHVTVFQDTLRFNRAWKVSWRLLITWVILFWVGGLIILWTL